MVITLNRMAGMPVIWQGRQIGLVDRAVADAQAHKLLGFVLHRGLAATRWIPLSGIEWVGERCVAVCMPPAPLPSDLPPQAQHVYLTSGRLAGQVADLLLSSATFRIVAVEVCPGPLYHLLGKSSYAREFQVVEENGQVMVSQLHPWAQLEQMLKEEGE